MADKFWTKVSQESALRGGTLRALGHAYQETKLRKSTKRKKIKSK